MSNIVTDRDRQNTEDFYEHRKLVLERIRAAMAQEKRDKGKKRK